MHRKLSQLTLACLIAVFGVACRHAPRGPVPVLAEDFWPQTYEVPATLNVMQVGFLQVMVHSISNGAGSTNIYADLTIKNLGTEPAEFNPDLFEVVIEDTGVTYFHITRDAGQVTVPVGFNLARRVALRPGQATQASLWFNTQQGAAFGKRVTLRCGDVVLALPPGAPAPAQPPAQTANKASM
jgi:hypothetical protein